MTVADMLELVKNQWVVSKNKVELLEKELKDKETLSQNKEDNIRDIEEASRVLTTVVGERTNTLKSKIEGIVNDGLNSIFSEDNVRIQITSSIKRNKTEYSIKILQDGLEGSVESFGGGVLAVIAFTLRVVMIVITGRDRNLFLDESLTYVSEQYQNRLSEFISKICKTLKFNIILISHQPKLSSSATRVYEAYRDNDNTAFKDITNKYKNF